MADFKFQNRRDFLKYSLGLVGSATALSFSSYDAMVQKKGVHKICILYTNDTHSRIEPFPENDAKYAGQGGFAKRAQLIEQCRKENEHVLVLDAGDIFQGTAYFNLFKGEIEYKLMSLMAYDACTFGNHDFDLGCENLVKQMPFASFDFINCNYELDDCALFKHPKIKPYKIYKKGNIKIGVLGVGIELENLVDKKLVKGIKYNSPIECANKISKHLKLEEKCDYVICLSHLGFQYKENKVSDVVLAKSSEYIDLIIGGHTHTFLSEPVGMLNLKQKEVKITQVGWAGIWLGKVEIYFSDNTKNLFQSSSNYQIK